MGNASRKEPEMVELLVQLGDHYARAAGTVAQLDGLRSMVERLIEETKRTTESFRERLALMERERSRGNQTPDRAS